MFSSLPSYVSPCFVLTLYFYMTGVSMMNSDERYKRAVDESIRCDKDGCKRKDCDGFLCRNAVEVAK